MSADSVLTIDDVAVHYGGIKAVDGVSFGLADGAISGILGPNGSGKSTLIAAITCLVPLTRGRMSFGGEPFEGTSPERAAHFGMSRTFQTVRLLHELTVRENVRLGADLARHEGRRSTRSESAAAADQAIERTGLGRIADVLPGELSYGAQRRVEIARAIAMSPKLLLLDEPTAGMNRDERGEIAALLRSLREEGMTQLLIEHDVQMMLSTCDYLYVMNNGRLIAQGLPPEVVRDEQVQEAYLGRRPDQHA